MIPRKLILQALRWLPLLVFPVVLAPALVMYVQRDQVQQYQSVATIWVLDPEQIQQAALNIDNSYLTPAQRQVSVIKDLLQTQSFRIQIAQLAGLAGPVPTNTSVPGTPTGDPVAASTASPSASALVGTDAALSGALGPQRMAEIGKLIGAVVDVSATGANLLTVTVTLPQGEGARRIGQAVIAAYDGRLREESTRQDAIALAYFEQQLTVADIELSRRREARENYVAAHPGVDLVQTGDFDYRVLASEVEAQTAIVTGLQAAIQRTHLEAVSASQALAARIHVLDQPSLPATPLVRSRVQEFGLPAAALGMALILSAAYLLLVYRLDHTIRSAEDLADIGVPFLGYAPWIRAGGAWWRPGRWTGRSGDRARRIASSFAMSEVR